MFGFGSVGVDVGVELLLLVVVVVKVEGEERLVACRFVLKPQTSGSRRNGGRKGRVEMRKQEEDNMYLGGQAQRKGGIRESEPEPERDGGLYV